MKQIIEKTLMKHHILQHRSISYFQLALSYLFPPSAHVKYWVDFFFTHLHQKIVEDNWILFGTWLAVIL
jgi:hypothetical protein